MKKYTITVTVTLENALWVAIFERSDDKGFSAARKIFGSEPADPELYDFILTHYHELKFTTPQDFELIIKRKNPKRMRREVKKEIEKSKIKMTKKSHAQEVLRLELEKNKKLKKTQSKIEREAKEQRIFLLRQDKKKQKHRGH